MFPLLQLLDQLVLHLYLLFNRIQLIYAGQRFIRLVSVILREGYFVLVLLFIAIHIFSWKKFVFIQVQGIQSYLAPEVEAVVGVCRDCD